MGMMYENIKTLVLITLVGLSLVLTWNLWTYQPAYDEVENTQYLQDENIAIGSKKELEDHIRPTQILYHREGKHYGSTKESDIEKWVSEMEEWKFSNISTNSLVLSKADFLEFVHSANSIEVVYPDTIPLNIFQLMFEIKEANVPSINFDRLVFRVKRGQTQSLSVYFIDYDRKKIHEAVVENFSKDQFQKFEREIEKNYTPHITYNISNIRRLFIPENPVKIDKLQYYTEIIDVEKFQMALFTNADDINRETSLYRDLYTDGPRILDVNTQTNVMTYRNLVDSNSESIESANLIKRSFNFINDHGGWTDSSYRFVSWNPYTKEVEYRFHEDGYPVFNNDGMTEISQQWGNAEILTYRRPLYHFMNIMYDKYQVTLMSGQEVLKLIQQHPQFDEVLLKKVLIGYELVRSADFAESGQKSSLGASNNFILEPHWFYYYNGDWYKVASEEKLGGQNNGLE